MDRIKFIPGAAVRERLESADGVVRFRHPDHLDIAQEFVNSGAPNASVLYQTALAALSKDDCLEISFSQREPGPKDEWKNGEAIGSTRATLFEASQEGSTATDPRSRTLWEVSRDTELYDEAWEKLAWLTYRSKVAAFLGERDSELGSSETTTSESISKKPHTPTRMSRAFSPTSIFKWSGIMWYFVDLGMPSSESQGFENQHLFLSRPCNVHDAFLLASLATLVYGRPPFVFAVSQKYEDAGQMPQTYRRAAQAEDHLLPQHQPGSITLVL